jgi:hypothetical protein
VPRNLVEVAPDLAKLGKNAGNIFSLNSRAAGLSWWR